MKGHGLSLGASSEEFIGATAGIFCVLQLEFSRRKATVIEGSLTVREIRRKEKRPQTSMRESVGAEAQGKEQKKGPSRTTGLKGTEETVVIQLLPDATNTDF